MKLVKLAFAALAFGALALQPALAADPVEGRNFHRLQMPQPTEANGKVEVIEFFWYGCPHCAKLEPLLKGWVKQLPADVSFRKVPAILSDKWAPGARLYYTLEAMNLLDKLSDEVFDAMINQRIDLGNENVLFDWIAKKGVDRKAFADTYKSFSVQAKVRQAAEMTQEYGFSGVPALVIGGKYSPGPELQSYEHMLQVADFLIARNRAEIKKPSAPQKAVKK
ncbi:thiol:disulfide interchange protein DsbA/DsbL [Sulfuricystis thermophila]|uniref:thiol:disulfide interchange protein DsbA/DsbL n=1 Tax=Sulfuricystis thermophila TaxID=2496847 RepID=UPI0015587D08|nr:thiol:disulfide interchange protein DsbA/DsbL [Sulfuricystis thermophila]